MSGKEKNLLKQAKQMNQPIPDRIKNKPVLKTGLNLYLDAFYDLQYDGNEAGNIPWTVIVNYADRYEFSEVQTEMLIYFVRRLNECFNKWHNKKRG